MQLWSSILATALGATVSPISDRTPDALQGEWVSDCAPVRPNSSKGSIIRVTIRGSKISAMGQVFATTLAALGCSSGQGFYFAKPIEADAALDYWKSRRKALSR